mmetsp:Transcript_9603/g.18122  ORF Transcript_9603/g.18122 Transcript_9603/m.18122 type:complete len:96 (+) Transcript_9603:263-550(+)
MSDQQKCDVLSCCKRILDLNVTTRVFVEDDEDDKVYEGDLCTARIITLRLRTIWAKKRLDSSTVLTFPSRSRRLGGSSWEGSRARSYPSRSWSTT